MARIPEPRGGVIWITGLSDAGKSTLAGILAKELRCRGKCIILLDGDVTRRVYGATETDYDRKSRLELAFRDARLCQVLAEQGLIVIIATIALLKEIHQWNRNQLPRYFDVLLDVPMDELRRRDSKRLYESFDTGKIRNVVGMDIPADFPLFPEYRVSFDPAMRPEQIAHDVVKRWSSWFDLRQG